MSHRPSGEIAPSDVVDFAAQLVQIPSVLGNEGAVADAVVETMQALRFSHAEIDGAGNAVGVIEGVRPGPTVVFDGHLDTVDVVPIEAWEHDPFGAQIVDGKMYGRGTTDMKGAVAAMVYGAALIPRENLQGRIVVSASIGEEWVEGAALRCVLDQHPADYVVIGEATNLELVIGGRGRAEFRLTAHGRASHASTPHLGVNAVHRMRSVIEEIEGIEVPQDSPVGAGVWALTALISDPFPGHSVVPTGCTATYERRLVPGETLESITGELQSACVRAGAEDTTIELAPLDYESYKGWKWSQPKWFPAWSLDRAHPLAQVALEALRNLGLDPSCNAYQFCTNAAYSAGEAGIPTIGLGPSDEALAHVSDEYIPVAELIKAVDAYRAVGEAILQLPMSRSTER